MEENKPAGMTDAEYIAALENALIFMCDWYVGLDRAVFQDYIDRQNEKYLGLPTIQGSPNRFAVEDIAKVGFEKTPPHGFRHIASELKRRRGISG